MRQEIRFTGMSTRPSAHDAPGGELDYCAGLVNDGDGLVAGEKLTEVVDMMPTGGTGDYIFKAVHEDRKIVEHKTGSGQSAVSVLKYRNETGYVDINTFAAGVTIGQVSSLGKYLVVLTSAGVEYAFWNGSTYKWLGAQPPRLQLQFGLSGTGHITETNVSDSFERISETGPDTSGYRTSVISDGEHKLNNLVYACTNKAREEAMKVTSSSDQPRFVDNFWVRYAYHMKDGSYQYASDPVLMPVSSGVNPVVIGTLKLRNAGGGSYEYDMFMVGLSRATTLKYCVRTSDFSLGNWADLIQGITIFVTKQARRDDESLDIPTTFKYKFGSGSGGTLLDADFISAAGLLTQKAVDYNGVKAFSGIFDDTALLDETRSRFISLQPNAEGVFIMQPESRAVNDYADEIRQVGPFYKLSDIPIQELPQYNTWGDVPIARSALANLAVSTVLEEGYRERDTKHADVVLPFNARLNLGRLSYDLFSGQTALEHCAETPFVQSQISLTARYYIQEDRKTVIVDSGQSNVPVYSSGGSQNILLSSFYYPNPKASKVVLYGGGSTPSLFVTLTLKECTKSNGACFTNPTFDYIPITLTRPSDFGTPSNGVSYPNRVIQSNVASLSFPAKGVQDVGQNSVRALATTAKSVHEFQSGQDPLYVFTEDAVWSMSLNDDGTYLSVRPASYDPIRESTLPVQTDDSVAFISRDGVRVLSGGGSVNISDILDSQATFRKAEVAKNATPASYVTGFDPVDISARFREFLTGAFLHFDYENKRLYAMCPNKTYCYVFSKEGKAWSLVLRPDASVPFAYSVQSYPDSYVVMGTKVWKFTPFDNDTGDAASGLVFTRPMALADGALFNVAEVKAEGVFTHTAKPQLVLYGTLDYKNWQLIATCQGPHMRGVHCPPFKAIRVGVNAPLTRRDSLTGVTIEFNPRFTARVR